MKAFVAFCVFAAVACLAVAQDEERPAPCTRMYKIYRFKGNEIFGNNLFNYYSFSSG